MSAAPLGEQPAPVDDAVEPSEEEIDATLPDGSSALLRMALASSSAGIAGIQDVNTLVTDPGCSEALRALCRAHSVRVVDGM